MFNWPNFSTSRSFYTSFKASLNNNGTLSPFLPINSANCLSVNLHSSTLKMDSIFSRSKSSLFTLEPIYSASYLFLASNSASLLSRSSLSACSLAANSAAALAAFFSSIFYLAAARASSYFFFFSAFSFCACSSYTNPSIWISSLSICSDSLNCLYMSGILSDYGLSCSIRSNISYILAISSYWYFLSSCLFWLTLHDFVSFYSKIEILLSSSDLRLFITFSGLSTLNT